jgi:hypothetical protein
MAQETIEETFAKGRAVLGDNQDQNRTRISDTETPAETLARARKTTPQPSLQVSANSLTNPPKAPVLTPPAIETPPPTGTADAVSKDLTEIISAQTQEAADLKKRRQEFAELGELGTLSDFRTEQLEEFGVPESTRQLKDIQLQLADIDTASDLTKTRIEGAAGQTVRGAQREVTQEDRENAVRRSGLAAKASVIQGNIETATSLVDQAVTTTYQDRTLKNNNLLNQINDLSGTVDEQTQQLLDAEKARVEADQAAVQEVKDAVSLAMQSGAATPQEVSQLTDINATDASRLALAQSISARGATEDRELAVAGQKAQNAASWALAHERMEGGETFMTPDGGQISVPTFEEWAEENGGRVWQVGGTEAEMENLRKTYDDEKSVMEQTTRVASLSPLAREVVNNPQAYYDFTATQKGEIFEEMSKVGLDTNEIISGKKKTLPATQVSDITQARGVKQDVEKLYSMLKDLEGTGPIAGRLQALDPFNAKRVAIEAQITRIVPGLARGIFNEVGVLTDQDVERYKNTLANPNMTDEQIELLHTDTMAKIDQSLGETITTFGLAGYDVEGFETVEAIPEQTPTDGLSNDEAYAEYQAQINKSQ